MANTINDKTESPCVRNCCLNEEDICLGCFRHLDEITAWHSMSELQKQQVLQQCTMRKAARDAQFNQYEKR
jgi:predicted Fe-S protein YdhL (DUF1289 family)